MPSFFPDDFDDGQREIFISRLPEFAKELVGVIGLDSTLSLCLQFGGRRIFFPSGKPTMGPRAAALFDELCEALGESGAARLGAHFDAGARDVYIPGCRASFSYLRNIEIRRDFDLKLKEGHSATSATSFLVRKYRLSYRAIELILNNGD